MHPRIHLAVLLTGCLSLGFAPAASSAERASDDEALLAFLPDAADDLVKEEIAFGIFDVARREGKIPAELLAALGDRAPLRRRVAACIVGRLGDGEQQKAVQVLLQDADLEVRLR